MPEVFLTSLLGKVIFSLEPSFAVSGDAIADIPASFCLRVVDPTPGSSKNGDSIIPLFFFL